MRVLSVAAAGIVLLLSAGTLSAAVQDAAGAWNLSYRTRDGQTLTGTLTLKIEGNQVSGTLSSPRGTVPIEEGRVNGDSITFAIIRVGFGDTIRIEFYRGDDKYSLDVKLGKRPEQLTAQATPAEPDTPQQHDQPESPDDNGGDELFPLP